MNLPNLVKNPLAAAILGAATIAAPVGVLYMAGATRAVATPQAATAAGTAAPAVVVEPGRGRPAGLQLHGAALRHRGGEHCRAHQGIAGDECSGR